MREDLGLFKLIKSFKMRRQYRPGLGLASDCGWSPVTEWYAGDEGHIRPSDHGLKLKGA